jgi:hypothetical protein
MTTDAQLHEALLNEAGGSADGTGGWDDVVRRGRHRKRVRRAQGLALVAMVAGVAGVAISLAGGDSAVNTGPPANQPSSSLPTASTTTTVPVPVDGRAHIQGARAQGVFLTVLIPWADPASGYDPCEALHPRVVESEDQIGIELVTEDIQRGFPFAACQSSPFSGHGLIELMDPVGDRDVIDLTTGNAVFLVDDASLLFPTVLPDGFDPEERDELASEGAWTFTFNSGDAYVNVTTGYGGTDECDEEHIEVRGTQGRLCRSGDGRFDVHWEEGGRTNAVEVGSSDPEQGSGLTLDDVLAIVEGLQPLDD